MRRLWRGEERRGIQFYCAVQAFRLFFPVYAYPLLTFIHTLVSQVSFYVITKTATFGIEQSVVRYAASSETSVSTQLTVAISQNTTIMLYNFLTK